MRNNLYQNLGVIYPPHPGIKMSDDKPIAAEDADSAQIIAGVLLEQYGEGALPFALKQEVDALDGSKEAWTNVVKRLRAS